MGPARNSGATYAVSSQSGTTCAVCRGDIKPKRPTQLDIQIESAAGQLPQMFSKETWILWANCMFVFVFLWQSIKKKLLQIHVLYHAVQPNWGKGVFPYPCSWGAVSTRGSWASRNTLDKTHTSWFYVTDVGEQKFSEFSEKEQIFYSNLAAMTR